MSHFIASMPAAGLIEMPPVSKVTPLPTNATGWPPLPPPFQRRISSRASRTEPWRDAEQRAHAELLHRLAIEHFDFDADALERLARRARRSFPDK